MPVAGTIAKNIMGWVTMNIDGVNIKLIGCDIPQDEIQRYIDYARKQEHGAKVDTMEIKLLDDGNVDLCWHVCPIKFERIRRITGYLVGTIDRWNNAKKAEEKERVKHDVRVGGNDG